MTKYILRRISYMVITLFFVITLTFFMMRSIPGDPLAHMARNLPEQTRINFYHKYGLDKPLFEQYLTYMKNLLTLDLGDSVVYPGRSVSDTIAATAPISGLTGGIALAFGLVLGVGLGIVAALFKNKWPDYLVMFLAILGITVPNFVLASLLQYTFSVRLGWLPTNGWGEARHLILPVICLCFNTIATYARYIKSSMLDTLSQDYILTAESKGVSSFNIVRKHVLRNSILPSITLLGGRIVGIFTGAFVVERMFGIPGIGTYYITSVSNKDYSMVLGTTIFYAFLFIVMQLIVDIVYVMVDPRIKLTNQKVA